MGSKRRAASTPSAAEALRSATRPQFRTLLDVTIDGPQTLSLSELARCTTDLVVSTIGVDLSGLGMFDKDNCARMIAASNHRSTDWERLVVDPGDGVASRVLSRGGSVSLKNYVLESQSSHRLVDVFVHGEGALGMLAVPVLRGDTVIGILYGGVRREEHIGDRGRTGLHNLATLFAATLPKTTEIMHSTTSHTKPNPNAAPGGFSTSRQSDTPQLSPGPIGRDLTEREKCVLNHLSRGLSTSEIAAIEYLAVNTVRSYVQDLLWKLGANSRLQAVAIAREQGLV